MTHFILNVIIFFKIGECFSENNVMTFLINFNNFFILTCVFIIVFFRLNNDQYYDRNVVNF